MKASRRGLRYDPDTDQWHDDHSEKRYLECDVKSKQPALLDITDSRWMWDSNGCTSFIDWHDLSSKLPPKIIEQARQAALKLLKTRSPGWISQLRLALNYLQEIFPKDVICWQDLTMEHWYQIWSMTKLQYHLYSLRVLYKQIALNEKNDVMLQRYSQITSFKIGKKALLEDVISWNPTTGAFVDEELEKIMSFLRKGGDDNANDYALRIIAWSYLHFGKRPLQMALVAADGLKRVTHQGVTQYFLEIPKVKAQRGRKPELWELSGDLVSEILRYSERPEVKKLQQQTGRLLIWNIERFNQGGNISSSRLNTELNAFMRIAGLTMQRDKSLPPEPLVFNARRARHTVGTQMAFDGAPAEYITRVLEHDSPISAKAYIDAVADLVQKAIDRADHALGGIFAGLAENYFSGRVTKDLTDRSVFLPDVSDGLLPIGSCGLQTEIYGECRKHPFYSCFGCSFFLVYRDADFTKARAHVQTLLQDWLDAEGQPERSQMVVEFERLYQGILQAERLTREEAK